MRSRPACAPRSSVSVFRSRTKPVGAAGGPTRQLPHARAPPLNSCPPGARSRPLAGPGAPTTYIPAPATGGFSGEASVLGAARAEAARDAKEAREARDGRSLLDWRAAMGAAELEAAVAIGGRAEAARDAKEAREARDGRSLLEAAPAAAVIKTRFSVEVPKGEWVA